MSETNNNNNNNNNATHPTASVFSRPNDNSNSNGTYIITSSQPVEIDKTRDVCHELFTNARIDVKKRSADQIKNIVFRQGGAAAKRVSHILSNALRHNAQQWGIPMSLNGFVKVDDLVKNIRFHNLNLLQLAALVRLSDKQRFAMFYGSTPNTRNTLFIRANQGHSIENIVVDMNQITNPKQCPIAVHGTTNVAWNKGRSTTALSHFESSNQMPSTEDFKSLVEAVEANKLDEVKKRLQRDDAKELLEMTYSMYEHTALMRACYNHFFRNTMSLDMIKLLCTEIKRIGGKTFLKEQLTLTAYTMHCLRLVCRDSPSHEIIQYVIDAILEAGGHDFLRELLELKDASSIATSFEVALANSSITTESLVLLCSLLFEFGLFKKQHDELAEDRKSTLKKHGIDLCWTPQQHFTKLLETSPNNAIAYFKSLLVYAPNTAVGELSSRPLTMCTVLFEHGLFKHQFSSLASSSKAELAKHGIKDASWSPQQHFNKLLEADDPRQALHQAVALCKYTSDASLTFLNDRVLHSKKLLRIFAAPSFVNYLHKRKLEGSLPVEFDRVYNKLMLCTAQKIDAISENQEPLGRKHVLQENIIDAMSLHQQAFRDLAVCVHEAALKSSLNEFRNLYFNFFKKKLELEKEAARRAFIRIEMKEFFHLSHRHLFESLSIERAHFIKESAKEFRAGIAYLLKTAPLRRVAEKHEIVLSENSIQKLSEENVMLTGEFEVLDKSRLDEMEIGKEERLKILRLVGLHKNEALVELRTENREMKKRVEETEKRSSLQATLFSLQQEKSSLIMKLRESPEKTRWIDSINHSMNIQTATLDELQQAVSDLEDQVLDLTQLLGHEKLTLFQNTIIYDTSDNTAHCDGELDDAERYSDGRSKDTYALEVEKEQVKAKEAKSDSSSTALASTKHSDF